MCGICGRFSIERVPFHAQPWDHLVDTMWRRGPDNRGLLGDDRCVLGARRLAVMDPRPDAGLPMQAESGRYWLAFNGELYNFRELRKVLTAFGHRFRSTGDSEVVLRALQHWGTGALDRFNGMFALAFYDRLEQSMVLARDHVGIKPLYVLDDSRGVVFASQYDQIMAHPWAGGRPADTDAVAMYLRLGHIPAPRGYLRDAGMLEPGSWLRIDATGRRERVRYHQFSPAACRPGQEQVEEVIAAAVRRQAVSDVAVGSLLSGGVDSPLIASCLGTAGPTPPRTFSVGCEDRDLDESADAAGYAGLIGSEHHVDLLREADVPDLFDEAVAATCEPLADEGILPSLLVARLARESVTVALSGEGGDELFWGYYPRQAALLGRCGDVRGTDYLPFFTEFTRAQFTECFPGLPFWPDDEPGYRFEVSDPREAGDALRQCEIEMYLPFILLKTDRASMHHSLEVRVPLLDREVMEVARGLRAGDCLDVGRGEGKLPLRRALRRRIGRDTAGKRGFTGPVDRWIRAPLRDHVADSLRSLGGLESVEVDTSRLWRLFDAHVRGEENNGMALWRILMLDQWVAKQRAVERRWAAACA